MIKNVSRLLCFFAHSLSKLCVLNRIAKCYPAPKYDELLRLRINTNQRKHLHGTTKFLKHLTDYHDITPKSLKERQKEKMMEQYKFECNSCYRVFEQEDHLKIHLRIHNLKI